MYDSRAHDCAGGNILKFYIGEDATTAFREFHSRSVKAHKMMKALPYRPVEDKRSELMKDYDRFRAELVEEVL